MLQRTLLATLSPFPCAAWRNGDLAHNEAVPDAITQAKRLEAKTFPPPTPLTSPSRGRRPCTNPPTMQRRGSLSVTPDRDAQINARESEGVFSPSFARLGPDT